MQSLGPSLPVQLPENSNSILQSNDNDNDDSNTDSNNNINKDDGN